MSRELQKGDALRALVVRETAPGGAQRLAGVLAARFTLSGSDVEAIRFADAAGRVEFYDAEDRSLRAAFLRAPLSFRRVSSTYGTRFHPILKIWRKHEGIDYAADAGTPVRAIGDGTVVFAGQRGGYGNLLEIRHPNGFVSRYGHLRAFAAGVRAGRRVTIGQTIAYVGQTGLATGPHLHFELLVNGAQRDPRKALAHSESAEIPAASREEFARQRAALVARLDGVAPAAPAASPPH
jgi:murein DD-endopeptidase MepM/ murein hydrolase activator NlpD